MKTHLTPGNPKDKDFVLNKNNFKVNLGLLLIGFAGLILTITSSIKLKANLVYSYAKKMNLSRSGDTLKLSHFFNFSNKGDNDVSLMAIRLVLNSKVRKYLSIEFDADSTIINGLKMPFTNLTVSKMPIIGNLIFSAPVDNTVISNLPEGMYTCTLEGVIDSLGKSIPLGHFDFYLDSKSCINLKGIKQRLKRSIRKYRIRYPSNTLLLTQH